MWKRKPWSAVRARSAFRRSVTVAAAVAVGLASVVTPPLQNSAAAAGLPTVQWSTWPQWSIWSGLFNTDYANVHTNFNDWTPSTRDAEQSRADRCRIGVVLHQGGPQVRSLAKTALETTDTARRDALTGTEARGTPLGAAASQDWNASPPPAGFETAQEQRWLTVINKFSFQSGVPAFDTAIREFIRNSDRRTYDAIGSDIVPRANAAATDKVKALVTEQKTTDPYLVALRQWQVDLGALYGEDPVDMTEIALRMSADDARMFLQYGGFAKNAPVPDSAEFRQEVESLKARWAGCDYRNPADPYRALVDVTAVAQAEWQAELDAQAGPRNVIVAAEAQAWKDMFGASTALTESVGQAWIADRMLAHQKSMGSTWKPPAAFTTALKGTQTAIDQQLVIANSALTSVKAQAVKADTAQEQAAQIAAANHTPRGRGLAYALQSVQVTKAAVAATEAATKAIATAKKTSLATTATSSALFAQACAEENALQAQFRRAASEEAAKQAEGRSRCRGGSGRGRQGRRGEGCFRAGPRRGSGEGRQSRCCGRARQAGHRRAGTAQRRRGTGQGRSGTRQGR